MRTLLGEDTYLLSFSYTLHWEDPTEPTNNYRPRLPVTVSPFSFRVRFVLGTRYPFRFPFLNFTPLTPKPKNGYPGKPGTPRLKTPPKNPEPPPKPVYPLFRVKLKKTRFKPGPKNFTRSP